MNLINCYDLDGNLKVTYVTRNRCYLLWDGHKIEEELRKYPAKVVVMDWQGELEKVYQLDNLIDFIIPDERQNLIYVGVYNPEIELVEIRSYPML